MDRKVIDRQVIDRQVIDRQIKDRQTGRNKADERWYPSRPCSVLSSGLWDTPAVAETHMRQHRNPYMTVPKPLLELGQLYGGVLTR